MWPAFTYFEEESYEAEFNRGIGLVPGSYEPNEDRQIASEAEASAVYGTGLLGRPKHWRTVWT